MRHMPKSKTTMPQTKPMSPGYSRPTAMRRQPKAMGAQGTEYEARMGGPEVDAGKGMFHSGLDARTSGPRQTAQTNQRRPGKRG